MPTPTDDIAGLNDATMGDRAALAIGWTWEIDDTGGYWWDTKNHAPVEWSDWHPSTDHNDAHRLVEECGRRGLKMQFGRALRKLLPGRAVVMHGGNYLADMLDLAAADGASATPRQIAEAAVRVLGGNTPRTGTH